jgi:hypothetical protein
MRTGLMVALGKEEPLVRFTVEADPPSIYVVYVVEDPVALAAHLGLPAGMELAPIRCLEGDESAYLLTLNVYRVSGITNGMRAEWSTYIADGAGVPRYLVVDARASGTSMDPVEVITRKSRVEYSRDGDALTIGIGEPGHAYEAKVALDGASPARSHPDWVSANDYIYWRNGVCDRTFYDAGMADAAQVAVDPACFAVADDTEWAPFTTSTPWRVLVVNSAMELVVSPWNNIDKLR